MSQSVLEAPTTGSFDNFKLAPRPASTNPNTIEHTTHAEAEALMAESIANGGDLAVLYSKPGCKDCIGTARSYLKYGVPFVKVDVMQDQEGLEFVLATGKTQMPYNRTARGESWTGYRIDKLMEHRMGLVALAAAA